MKKTESEPIQLTNHEKNMLRKLARQFAQNEKNKRKAIIMQEDKEDEKYRRKIVK